MPRQCLGSGSRPLGSSDGPASLPHGSVFQFAAVPSLACRQPLLLSTSLVTVPLLPPHKEGVHSELPKGQSLHQYQLSELWLILHTCLLFLLFYRWEN